jgi:hypothetical protein
MATFEWGEGSTPGVDEHTWESTWASIEEDAADDPDGALSQFADLVQHVLATSGYHLVDPVAAQGEDPEVVVAYRSARDTAERAELGAASRSEVEQAIADLREVFTAIVNVGRR